MSDEERDAGAHPKPGYVHIPGSGGFDYPRGIDLGPEFLLHLRDEDRRAGRGPSPRPVTDPAAWETALEDASAAEGEQILRESPDLSGRVSTCATCAIHGEACPGGLGHDVCEHGNDWDCCSECGCYCQTAPARKLT